MAQSSLPRSLNAPGERALIEALNRQLGARAERGSGVRIGIGDDCAILRVPAGHELTVTTDLLLETTHFRRDWHAPESVGHRCLARGLSDVAAMGAKPLAAFLSIAVPTELTGNWLTRFFAGLLALADKSSAPLAGGDTAEAPFSHQSAIFTADIMLLGTVPRGKALLRSGAGVGDHIYVTGALGGSAAELQSLQSRPESYRGIHEADLTHPQLFPQPRLKQGQRLRSVASAAIDISDGLATDLAHLCKSSRLRAEIDAAAIPLHCLAQVTADPLSLALFGGEDYELLFTADTDTRVPRSITGVPVHCIGRMMPPKTGAPLITLVQENGAKVELPPGGWEHFRSSPAK